MGLDTSHEEVAEEKVKNKQEENDINRKMWENGGETNLELVATIRIHSGETAYIQKINDISDQAFYVLKQRNEVRKKTFL